MHRKARTLKYVKTADTKHKTHIKFAKKKNGFAQASSHFFVWLFAIKQSATALLLNGLSVVANGAIWTGFAVVLRI